MDNTLNLPQSIIKSLNSADDLLAVMEQINKDFALQGFQLIANPQDHNAFLEEIRGVMSDMISNDVSGLAALLYRIDIPESAVNRALMNSKQDSDVLLVKLIAQREYQKVLSRRMWSN